jgi:hypothetical protein
MPIFWESRAEVKADFAFWKVRFEDCLRHHLGHTLLYLDKPKARNGCADADRKWRASLREELKTKRKNVAPASEPFPDPDDPGAILPRSRAATERSGVAG